MDGDRSAMSGEDGVAVQLVLIHGSGDSGRCWGEVVRHLGALGRRAVALDLPGHGARVGEPPPDPATVAEYAQAVRREIEARGDGGTGVALVGHSLGSAIALRLALDAPELVERLALVGAGARLRVLPAMLELARTQPDEAWRQVVALGHAPGHEQMAAAYAEAAAPTAPGALYRDLVACDGFDVMGELDSVRQPTLVLVGAEDRLTPPKYAAYLVEHLPHATGVTLPGAGHFLMHEAPEEMARSLCEWLSDTGRRVIQRLTEVGRLGA
jgi:pimeloyl-ACP methyl ester carboxylesterase